MSPTRVCVLVAAVCFNSACSRNTGSKESSARTANRARPAPAYSAQSIAPIEARQPAPLAPGRVVSIYGQELGPTQGCHGAPTLPVKLCGTEVQVGGVAAGLLYVSAGQINFKVPQTAPTQGHISVQVLRQGEAGPRVPMPVTTNSQAGSAEQIAARMWSSLQRVKWRRQYQAAGARCAPVPAHQGVRGGLHGHAYYCAQTIQEVIAESFYYPVDHARPKLLLLRADIRPVNAYPELSAEVEQSLIRRLTRAHGPGSKPGHLYEIGAGGLEPGLVWRTGNIAIFLHRNRSYADPAGVREGVILIAVSQEILNQREAIVEEQQREANALAMQPLKSEAERVKAQRETRIALLRLLRRSTGDRERRAADLVTADNLARRLGSLLIVRSVNNGAEQLTEAEEAAKVRIQLAAHGARFGEIGHYSGDLTYGHGLLQRAWKEYPETDSGQRAFLTLQRLSCAIPRFGCAGPNCFLSVIRQGETFLQRFPDTKLRKEQTYHLAIAHETWWSLGQAEPGDITAEGARVTKVSSEEARRKAIELYEELLRMAPDTPEALAAERALPRLKLKLDSRERKFFCFSC